VPDSNNKNSFSIDLIKKIDTATPTVRGRVIPDIQVSVVLNQDTFRADGGFSRHAPENWPLLLDCLDE
jgi:hypothetical protein